jgi:DNA polymerase-3 subunit gamma/tau
LQPRLHLEIGLLRLIQAGKLVPIEEALADLGSGGAPPPPSRKPPPPSNPQPPIAKPQAANPQPPTANPQSGPWRDRLHAAAAELGLQTTADAIEHSEVAESNGKLTFVTPEDYRLFMNEKDILKVVQKVAGRAMRFDITFGTPQASAPVAKPKDDVSERALSHPDVKRFQELFPDAQVRVVRNLKE